MDSDWARELVRENVMGSAESSHGRIGRSQAATLCMITSQQATNLLRRLVGEGRLELRGEKRGAHYVLAGSG